MFTTCIATVAAGLTYGISAGDVLADRVYRLHGINMMDQGDTAMSLGCCHLGAHDPENHDAERDLQASKNTTVSFIPLRWDPSLHEKGVQYDIQM